MSFAVGYSLAEAQLQLTLAALAYVDEKAAAGRDDSGTDGPDATGYRHRVEPVSVLGLAGGLGTRARRRPWQHDVRRRHQTTGQYAVAVARTDWSFWLDWVEDFASLLPLVPFPYVVPSGADGGRIAAGTLLGLVELSEMTGTTPGGGQSDMATFLKALRPVPTSSSPGTASAAASRR